MLTSNRQCKQTEFRNFLKNIPPVPFRCIAQESTKKCADETESILQQF